MPSESLLYERSDFEALVEIVAANRPAHVNLLPHV
jgi:hypothetical protein